MHCVFTKYTKYWETRIWANIVDPDQTPHNAASDLRSHYENTPIQIYWKFYHKKKWKFSDKNSDIFHISAQNIDCGYSLEPPRQGGSNEYPQSMFLSKNENNNVYPRKPQFYYIKVGFKGVKIILACFRDVRGSFI